ncbi:MAG TPA: cyclase family protein [Actinomycetota bacterium]
MPRLIDLSQEIYTGMYVYPGHLKTVVFDHASHEETSERFEGGFSFQTTGLLVNDNGPTHVDSFSHLDPDPEAASIDQMPLELFYGDAICLDVSACRPRTDVEPAQLEAALEISGLELRRGDILLLYTATWNRYHGTREYLTSFPGLGAAGSQWLVDRGVKTFGVDSPTPDNPTSRSYPCHMMCRAEHITHYENLANLDKVSGRRFTFAGFPLRIRGGHGGPTRAVALLDD